MKSLSKTAIRKLASEVRQNLSYSYDLHVLVLEDGEISFKAERSGGRFPNAEKEIIFGQLDPEGQTPTISEIVETLTSELEGPCYASSTTTPTR